MKEFIEIERSDAIKAHKNADTKGKAMLEDLLNKKTFQKNVMERIKTIEDVFKDQGIIASEFYVKYQNLEEDTLNYEILKLICKALNEDWEADWKDSSQYKYYPWFIMNEGLSGFRYGGCDGWTAYTTAGSRLCFKSEELAKYAATQFVEVFRKYLY